MNTVQLEKDIRYLLYDGIKILVSGEGYKSISTSTLIDKFVK